MPAYHKNQAIIMQNLPHHFSRQDDNDVMLLEGHKGVEQLQIHQY